MKLCMRPRLCLPLDNNRADCGVINAMAGNCHRRRRAISSYLWSDIYRNALGMAAYERQREVKISTARQAGAAAVERVRYTAITGFFECSVQIRTVGTQFSL